MVAIQGVRVLLVEDHTDTRETLATLLRRAGGKVEALPSAQEAFDSFQAGPPDVLVCDLGLPGATGCNLMRRIRAAHKEAHQPAIAITGQPKADAQDLARDAGFDAFMIKPILADELLLTINRLLGR
jgi:CheY-like chemotaxis protein